MEEQGDTGNNNIRAERQKHIRKHVQKKGQNDGRTKIQKDRIKARQKKVGHDYRRTEI